MSILRIIESQTNRKMHSNCYLKEEPNKNTCTCFARKLITVNVNSIKGFNWAKKQYTCFTKDGYFMRAKRDDGVGS